MYVAITTVGGLLAFAGSIWIIVLAFKTSPYWGAACLLFPFAQLVFVLVHFSRTWRPFALNVTGVVLMSYGSYMWAQGSVQAMERRAERHRQILDPEYDPG